HLRAGLIAEPQNVLNWLVLAMAYQQHGEGEKGRQWLDKARQWIEEKTRDLPDKGRRAVPDRWFWRDWYGVLLLPEKAESLIEGKPAPLNPWLRLVRGRAYAMLGHPEKAEPEFDAAVAEHPNDPVLRRARGRVFAELGWEDHANADFAKADELVTSNGINV